LFAKTQDHQEETKEQLEEALEKKTIEVEPFVEKAREFVIAPYKPETLSVKLAKVESDEVMKESSQPEIQN